MKMKFVALVALIAVISEATSKESKNDKSDKPKRQIDSIRSPQNLQYSLVLPHSRVSSFRALTNRRISNAHARPVNLPPYAVQMEPMVQYSQKDPLYDPSADNVDELLRNELQAQPKILNIHKNDLSTENNHVSEAVYDPEYGSLPTAPLYSQPPHYYEEPEPIIEIIIKESNESLPTSPPLPQPIKKKEPVQVFYVKYTHDPHVKGKLVYEKPIPAITPPSNKEEDHQDYVTVTPEPYYSPPQTTTLRTIIKPDSQIYHSESGVKVTFGSEHNHYEPHHSNRRDELLAPEGHDESAPRPAIAYPQLNDNEQLPQEHQQFSESKFSEQPPRPQPPFPKRNGFVPQPQKAQSRIQFQPTFVPNQQQLPRQSAGHQFRNGPPHVSRQGPFSTPLSPSQSPPFPGQLSQNSPLTPSFSPAFSNGPTNFPGPLSPSFSSVPSRPPPNFHARPSNPPSFQPRPSPPFPNGPPRPNFQSGLPKPSFHPGPQPHHFFDEPKYLQENYHTITTEELDSPKDQARPQQSFDFVPRPGTHLNQNPNNQIASSPPSHVNPTTNSHLAANTPTTHNQHFFTQFNEHSHQSSHNTQLLPQIRPHQQFHESQRPHYPVLPTKIPIQGNFYNTRPQPPHPDQSVPIFNQNAVHQSFGFNQQAPSLQPTQPHNHQSGQPNRFPSPNVSPNLQTHNSFQSQEKPQQNLQQPQKQQERPESFHQQNLGGLVPNGGELVASIPKYEQHITVTGSPTAQPDYQLGQSVPTSQNSPEQQVRQQNQKQHYDAEQEQVRQQLAQNVQKQQEEIQRLQTLLNRQRQESIEQEHRNEQNEQNYYNQQQYIEQQRQVQQYIQDQQQRATPQQHQQQHQHQHQQQHQEQHQHQHQQQHQPQQQQFSNTLFSSKVQSNSEKHGSPTTSSPFYQSTSRTVDITPTTSKYASSTLNSIKSAEDPKKSEKKKKPTFELPDEVPDDLRQQLLSSGILDNADISVLDYDKIGDTNLESLPPDQLANFFSAGGAQQIAASEQRQVVVKPNGEEVVSKIDDMEEDQETSPSENVPSYISPASEKKEVEMKVVHFDPSTLEGQKIATDYVQENATKLDTVALNDKKYNRYLPLKVSGNQFPLPDILKGKRVTSVVVLAPVETESINPGHTRLERATENKLQGIKFVAGDSFKDLLHKPTRQNFDRWLDVEKNTDSDQQSVILLVTGSEDNNGSQEIYMYDIESKNVNKLDGELSAAFVDAAENNALSKDIEKLALDGDGIPENFQKDVTTEKVTTTDSENSSVDNETEPFRVVMEDQDEDDVESEASENVPFYADFSSMKLDPETENRVSISSGYSKTKLGRTLRHN